MTEIGEKAAVTKLKKAKPGELRVQVRDACNNKLIEDVEVSIGSDKQTTDSSGEVTFSKLPAGTVAVQAKKHFKNADYSTFLIHYPKLMRDHEAKSQNLGSADIAAGGKVKLRIPLEVYKLVGNIIFHRKHIDIGGADKYGHWWTVIDSSTSFGWWPKYPMGSIDNQSSPPPTPPAPLPANAGNLDKIGHMFESVVHSAKSTMHSIKESSIGQTLGGVEGDLNGMTSFGGSASMDPHHISGDSGDEQYAPVRKDCFKITDIKKDAEAFASSYKGGWSWRFEGGNHCHTFQKKLMTQHSLDKVKVIK